MTHVLAQENIDDLSKALTETSNIWDYVTAVAIFIGAIVLGRIVRSVFKRTIGRSSVDDFLGDLLGRLANYVIVVFGIIYTLDTLGIAIGPILGALGIAGFAVAFAFQDILENFVAGVILQVRQPFSSGDEIETADHQGKIVAIDARTITINTPDGETVRVPSAEVLKNPIVNLTQQGRRRTTVDVGVGYESDLDVVTDVALATLSNIDEVLKDPEPEVLVHTYGPSSIDVAIRYWHHPSIASYWRTRNAVIKAVTKTFRENDINIPFPQQVVTINKPPDSTDSDYLERTSAD